MSNNAEQLTALLKDAGYSVTRPRLAIFRALAGQEPMSMHQLIQKVPDYDRASVYRAVELFERLGVVQRLNIGWKYKLELSDKFAEHHHHLSCTQCGRTISLNESELERLVADLATSHDFVPVAHQIEIQGLCAPCRANRRARESF